MHKIDAPNATGLNEFTDGDPALGVLSTVLWSKWLNTVQRELIAIVVAGGIVPSDANDAQVIAAIQNLIAAHASLSDNPHDVTKAQVGLGNVANVGPIRAVNASDGGPYLSSVHLDVDASVPESAWRSVGPTGSGAQHIWTALDLVPAGYNWIELAAGFDAWSNNDSVGYHRLIRAGFRRTGSALGLSSQTLRIESLAPHTDATGYTRTMGHTSFRVPLDASRRFDLHWVSSFNDETHFNLYLAACGQNG